MDVDIHNEPLGDDRDGRPVYLRDLWPSPAESQAALATIRSDMFLTVYGSIMEGTEEWRALEVPAGDHFAWEPDSTYVREPPFFDEFRREPTPLQDIVGARALAVLGGSVTTDHISPAGAIAAGSAAARYLAEQGVQSKDFSSYGARRGNHEVMMRGTFANVRLRNQLVEKEGPWTQFLPAGEEMAIYDAAMRYREDGVPLIIIAGEGYGAGSSRDWAAKGPALLGVRAVIVESFERIHRSNLVGMGVLPLEFEPGATAGSLGLTGRERFDIEGIAEGLTPGGRLEVRALADDGKETRFWTMIRIDTPVEAEYYRHGGILPYVLRQLAT